MTHLIRLSLVALLYFIIRPFVKDRKKFNIYFFTIWGIGIIIEVFFTIYILSS
jgi:hypothetical protein